MASIGELRDGIATNLATITGLRTSDTMPDNPSPPIAVVSLSSVEYDQTFQRGMTLYTFDVTVIVSRADARNAQNYLDTYCSSTGANSVKLAIESDKTLNGKAFDLRVTQLSSYGSLTVNDTTYLAAEFSISCYAS
jgi:hypothetical protein